MVSKSVTIFLLVCIVGALAAPQCVCPYNYAPVCGSDGKDYGNASCMRCENPNLTVAKMGLCGVELQRVEFKPQ